MRRLARKHKLKMSMLNLKLMRKPKLHTGMKKSVGNILASQLLVANACPLVEKKRAAFEQLAGIEKHFAAFRDR
jgi:hypothetical protein